MNTQNLKTEIKKIKVKHVALLCAGIFVAFFIIGTVFVIAGGGFIKSGGFGWEDFSLSFGPGQLYDVNDRTELDMQGVTVVEIAAINERVTVLSGGEKAVAELKGQCRSANGPVYLDARRSGDKVFIEVKHPRGSSINSTGLTVTIPAGYQGDLSVHTVSGGIRAENLPNKLGQVSLGTTSGSIRLETASYARLDAGSVSGSIRVAGIEAETEVHTTSGRVELEYASAAETKVTTISGSVRVVLPSDAEVSVNFNSISGGFRSDHPGLNVSRAGRAFSSVTQGAPLIDVNTVSGGFRIEEE